MSKEPRYDMKQPDELAQRRLKRTARPDADPDEEGATDEIKFTWSDTFAMIIAAYQVLLPMLGLMIGAMILVYLGFIWFFK